MKKKHRPVSEKRLSETITARFMRVKDYAGHLGISERALREWIYAGVIPVIKVKGHLILIDPVKADTALERPERAEVKA